MRNIIVVLLFIVIPHLGFSQDKIVGQFSSETSTQSIGQQIAQQGAGTIYTIGRSYLNVQGKKYKLYRYSKNEVDNMKIPNNGLQQVQQPLSVLIEDYYLLGNHLENGKYCLITGTIDKVNNIIYNANITLVFNESMITEALNKCGY